MKNYLVHLRTTRFGMKSQTYHTVVAVDPIEAHILATELADLLPGTVAVVSVKVI